MTGRGEFLLWCWWFIFLSSGCLWQWQLLPLAPRTFVLLSLSLLLPVLVLEMRARVMSDFLARVLDNRGRTTLFLALLLVAAVKFYGLPGYRLYTMGDGPPHFVNVWMAYEALRQAEMPFWTNGWACGSPFLQFYPPLFPLLTAGLLFLHLDIFTAVRIVLSLSHFLSGFAMYGLARSLSASRGGALLSALCYVLAPWHVFQLFHFNRFPVAMVYTLLPLLFLSTELLRRHRPAALLLGSMSLAGISLSHQGYAVFAAILFGGYTLLRILPDNDRTRPGRYTVLLHLGGVYLVGLGLAAFLLIPHQVESPLLPFLPSLGRTKGLDGFLMDNPYLATLFAWRRQPAGHSGYLGISLFLLSLAGVVVRVRRRGPAWAALLAGYAFSYYLVLGHENRFYSLIPFVYSQFYAGRYLIFLVFFLSICAGLCFRTRQLGTGSDEIAGLQGTRSDPYPHDPGTLEAHGAIPGLKGNLSHSRLPPSRRNGTNKPRGRRGDAGENRAAFPPPVQHPPADFLACTRPPAAAHGPLRRFVAPRLLLLALAVVALDLGPISTYVQRSPRHPLPDLERVYAAIREKRTADPATRLGRAVDLPRELRTRNHGSLILPLEAGCPTPEAGQFGTLGSYAYIYKMLKNARETLPLREDFSEELREALLLLNLRWLFTDTLAPAAAERLGGENLGDALWLFTFPGASPVISSACVENIGNRLQFPQDPIDMVQDRWDPPDAVERLLAEMEIDLQTRQARRLLIRSGPPVARCFPEPAGEVTVVEQQLRPASLRLSLSAPSDCYLHVSQSWYPFQRVLIDRKPCEEVYRSCFDFIVIPFPKGEHTLEVEAFLSPLRRVCLAVSGVFLLLWLFLFLVCCRRTLRKPRMRCASGL